MQLGTMQQFEYVEKYIKIDNTCIDNVSEQKLLGIYYR